MTANKDHICVCICTYKRPELLNKLLKKLQNQITEGLFLYSIVVVDNDSAQSARSTVDVLKNRPPIDIDYYVEPEQNIALARNKAVENAKGNFIAFIDDDEVPTDCWLLDLYKACNKCKADGVLGPVKPYFEKEPPQWIIRGKILERPSFSTGTILHWKDTRTGNVLLKKYIFDENNNIFDPLLGKCGGEDKEFFKKNIKKGYVFVWCDEAAAYEFVPQKRLKRSYFLKRALLRGRASCIRLKRKNFLSRTYFIIKAISAILVYTLLLPFLLFFGQHVFMKYFIKDCHHIGSILGFLRIGSIASYDIE